MAVFSISQLFLPDVLFRRGIGRMADYFAAATRVTVALSELGLFLWMALAIAFSLLVIAGFFV